uniref:Secreted protein n=1 Tax=Kalanchoe fedtschenkoi TaxID=63787 RepID=A0A7N0VB25_KALFE
MSLFLLLTNPLIELLRSGFCLICLQLSQSSELLQVEKIVSLFPSPDPGKLPVSKSACWSVKTERRLRLVRFESTLECLMIK